MTRKSRHRIQKKSFTNLMFQTKLMKDESFLTDVKLICEDKEFWVHKLILSAASPYFKEKCKENSQITSLHLDFLTSKILETVLMFIYEGRIDVRNQSRSFLKDLTEASIELQIPLMYNHCLEQLLGTHLPEQLLSKWNIIEQLNSDRIKTIYLEYLCKNIRTLKTTECFFNLSFNQLNSLLGFCVEKSVNHEEIIRSILLWVKYSQMERENRITELLKHVDFSDLSYLCLVKFFEEPLLEGNLYFDQQLGKMFRNQLRVKKMPIPPQGKKELEKQAEKKTPSSMTNKNSSSHQDSEAGKKMEPQGNDSQEKRKEKAVPKIVPKKVSLDHKEKYPLKSKRVLCYDYLIFNGILEYNANSRTWTKVNDELLIRTFSRGYGYAVCSFDNYIYFFGGENSGGEITNQCYCLDLVRNSFLEIPAMREKRWFAKAVKLRGFIYVIGGSSDKNTSQYCRVNERYNLITQTWDKIPGIAYPYCASSPRVITVGDRLCLVGMVHLIWFDPECNEWKNGERLPFRFNLSPEAVVYANGKIFILDYGTNNIFILDLRTNCWDTVVIPGVELYFRDIEDIGKEQFLVMCCKKSLLYTPPDNFTFLPSVPFESPNLIVI